MTAQQNTQEDELLERPLLTLDINIGAIRRKKVKL